MFFGSIPALVTPFAAGRVDEAAFRALIDWQIEEGSSALVPCGTTGETATLSHEEQHRLFTVAVEAARCEQESGIGEDAVAPQVAAGELHDLRIFFLGRDARRRPQDATMEGRGACDRRVDAPSGTHGGPPTACTER